MTKIYWRVLNSLSLIWALNFSAPGLDARLSPNDNTLHTLQGVFFSIVAIIPGNHYFPKNQKGRRQKTRESIN
jgi:hypothetical protein